MVAQRLVWRMLSFVSFLITPIVSGKFACHIFLNVQSCSYGIYLTNFLFPFFLFRQVAWHWQNWKSTYAGQDCMPTFPNPWITCCHWNGRKCRFLLHCMLHTVKCASCSSWWCRPDQVIRDFQTFGENITHFSVLLASRLSYLLISALLVRDIVGFSPRVLLFILTRCSTSTVAYWFLLW